MAFGSHKSIESLTPQFVEAIIGHGGEVDGFVDSAEGSLVGLPNLDADRQARELDRKLTEQLSGLALCKLRRE